MNIEDIANKFGPGLQRVGDKMARGVALTKKMTEPIRYGMSTLEQQLVKPFSSSPKKASGIVATPSPVVPMKKPSLPIGRKYQNYLDQVDQM